LLIDIKKEGGQNTGREKGRKRKTKKERREVLDARDKRKKGGQADG
jgi:hypothetical protein